MDFILKKFVSFFMMPFSLGILLFIVGLLFLYRNKIKKAKIILTISLLWFSIISYAPLVNTLLYQYESQIPTLHQAPKGIQYIYVLGAGHHTDDTQPITAEVNPTSLVRLAEGIRLYHQLYPRPTLIVSGYGGLKKDIPHAMMQKELAIALGVNPKDIHTEPLPRDTEEEAIVAKKFIGTHPFILVTSASHMPRALKFFDAQGLTPTPAPTNHLSEVKNLDYTEIYKVVTLYQVHILWHEILGSLWQWMKSF